MDAYPTLLEQFLSEECTPYVRQMILAAVETRRTQMRTLDFEFNRFNLKLDFDAEQATVSDETDVSEAGLLEVPLSLFLTAIRAA
jgi:hypothetical protein